MNIAANDTTHANSIKYIEYTLIIACELIGERNNGDSCCTWIDCCCCIKNCMIFVCRKTLEQLVISHTTHHK